jgi:hypothetical protein
LPAWCGESAHGVAGRDGFWSKPRDYRALAGADFFSLILTLNRICSKNSQKRRFSLHLVVCKGFRRFKTQLSPTEAGLESTISDQLKGSD